MKQICKHCGEEVETNPHLTKLNSNGWFHVKTGMMRCNHFAQPVPNRPTRQERAN